MLRYYILINNLFNLLLLLFAALKLEEHALSLTYLLRSPICYFQFFILTETENNLKLKFVF